MSPANVSVPETTVAAAQASGSGLQLGNWLSHQPRQKEGHAADLMVLGLQSCSIVTLSLRDLGKSLSVSVLLSPHCSPLRVGTRSAFSETVILIPSLQASSYLSTPYFKWSIPLSGLTF